MAGPFTNHQELNNWQLPGAAPSPTVPSDSSYSPLSVLSSIASIALPVLSPILNTVGQLIANTHAFNKQNEYNLPVNQMQRLRDAGINPYSAANQISGQNQSAVMQPTRVDSNAIFDNLVKVQQLKQLKLENEGKQIDNDISRSNLFVTKNTENFRVLRAQYNAEYARLLNSYQQGQITRQSFANKLTQLQSEYYDWYNNNRLQIGDDPNDPLVGIFGANSIISPREAKEVYLPLMQQATIYLRERYYQQDIQPLEKKRISTAITQLQKSIDAIEESTRHAKSTNAWEESTQMLHEIERGISTLTELGDVITPEFNVKVPRK